RIEDAQDFAIGKRPIVETKFVKTAGEARVVLQAGRMEAEIEIAKSPGNEIAAGHGLGDSELAIGVNAGDQVRGVEGEGDVLPSVIGDRARRDRENVRPKVGVPEVGTERARNRIGTGQAAD